MIISAGLRRLALVALVALLLAVGACSSGDDAADDDFGSGQFTPSTTSSSSTSITPGESLDETTSSTSSSTTSEAPPAPQTNDETASEEAHKHDGEIRPLDLPAVDRTDYEALAGTWGCSWFEVRLGETYEQRLHRLSVHATEPVIEAAEQYSLPARQPNEEYRVEVGAVTRLNEEPGWYQVGCSTYLYRDNRLVGGVQPEWIDVQLQPHVDGNPGWIIYNFRLGRRPY